MVAAANRAAHSRDFPRKNQNQGEQQPGFASMDEDKQREIAARAAAPRTGQATPMNSALKKRAKPVARAAKR
jgi:hypothetical protein